MIDLDRVSVRLSLDVDAHAEAKALAALRQTTLKDLLEKLLVEGLKDEALLRRKDGIISGKPRGKSKHDC